MNVRIKEMRLNTGLTQKEFAALFEIPLSTLRKWEQGESTPPGYVVRLMADKMPESSEENVRISGRNGAVYYYNSLRKTVSDNLGNSIIVSQDLNKVKDQNLALYLNDLFEDYYAILEKFNNDCKMDLENDIIWE